MVTIKFIKKQAEKGTLEIITDGKPMDISVKEELITTLTTYLFNDRTVVVVARNLRRLSQQFHRAFYLAIITESIIEIWEVSKKNVERIFEIPLSGGKDVCSENTQQ